LGRQLLTELEPELDFGKGGLSFSGKAAVAAAAGEKQKWQESDSSKFNLS